MAFTPEEVLVDIEDMVANGDMYVYDILHQDAEKDLH